MTGVRKMLVLVWSKEQDVKVAVVKAYRRLYIDGDNHNERFVDFGVLFAFLYDTYNTDIAFPSLFLYIKKREQRQHHINGG